MKEAEDRKRSSNTSNNKICVRIQARKKPGWGTRGRSLLNKIRLLNSFSFSELAINSLSNRLRKYIYQVHHTIVLKFQIQIYDFSNNFSLCKFSNYSIKQSAHYLLYIFGCLFKYTS